MRGKDKEIFRSSCSYTRTESKAIAFIAGSAFEGEEWRVVELEKKISQLKVSSQVRRIDYYANTTELYNMFDILYFQVLIQTLYQRLY